MVSTLLIVCPLFGQTTSFHEQLKKYPWPVQLGLRVDRIERSFPLIDRVVLVPDAVTYLNELNKWSPRGRWPVLIEDDRLAAMFIRRFQPAEVIRRDSVGHEIPQRQDHKNALQETVIRAWGGDPVQHTWRDVFGAQSHTPPGVVITSIDDPAWTGAVALAAGRGQPLHWLEGNYAQPDDYINDDAQQRLRQSIEQMIQSLGLKYDKLGDCLETITICRNIATKAYTGPAGVDQSSRRAITDLIGRHADGRRYAFCGLIFGDETRAAYVAMCSLFLPRNGVLLYNSYETNGEMKVYDIEKAADALRKHQFSVDSLSDSRVNHRQWGRQIEQGLDCDLFMMNSSGEHYYFRIAPGVNATVTDAPLFNVPAAVHFIHSFSMQVPTRVDSVGGRLWNNGAYAFVGAMDEPFLSAFLPPEIVVERINAYIPFLVAARHWTGDHQFARPWKVNTFGDPLMIIAPPDSRKIERVHRSAEYGTNLLTSTRSMIEHARNDPTDTSLREAIELFNLLGRDEIVIQLWRHARQSKLASAAAHPALGALFRSKLVDEFLVAWDFLGLRQRDRIAVDMLWHLVGPTLNSSTDEQTLLYLESAIRHPHSYADIERLAPHLARVLGRGHVVRLIQREIDRAPNDAIAERLRALSGKY